MTFAYLIASVISVALWTPIFMKFYRSWTRRRNPISLAICAAIALIIWSSLAGMWIVTDRIRVNTFLVATSAMSAVVAIYAHAAFHWSNKRFNDERSNHAYPVGAQERRERRPTCRKGGGQAPSDDRDSDDRCHKRELGRQPDKHGSNKRSE